MQARRSFAHGPEGGWSAVALHLEAAEPGKEGFYLTLYPDGRPPTTVFLLPLQLTKLIDMAAQSAISDQQIWDAIAKIPLEPLLPSRTLAARLRQLLVDCAGPMRDLVRAQGERRPAASAASASSGEPSLAEAPPSDEDTDPAKPWP
jgi:hypothetical protein